MTGTWKKLGYFVAALAVLALGSTPAYAQKARNNGTTLAGYKTMDICVAVEAVPASDNGTPDDPSDDTAAVPAVWRYSGEIAAWNQGQIDTTGFAIEDCLQTKTITGGTQFTNAMTCVAVDTLGLQIPAGTTQLTALIFPYSFEGAAYPQDTYYIKNVANLTIMNHSNYIGTPFGPSPKVTWDGGDPPLCDEGDGDLGCTYTQGYWGSKPDVVWPDPYSRAGIFFQAATYAIVPADTNGNSVFGECISGCSTNNPNDDVFDVAEVATPQTWQQVLDTPVNASQGYYQLAHQYIAAVLNLAKVVDPAVAPEGVQDTIDAAAEWLAANNPKACMAASSCGLQKDWAAVLASFNEGTYPGGPLHCSDE